MYIKPTIFVHLGRSDIIKRFHINLRLELFERVKLLAKEYNLSINKMMIKLIEIGYLKMIGDGINE